MLGDQHALGLHLQGVAVKDAQFAIVHFVVAIAIAVEAVYPAVLVAVECVVEQRTFLRITKVTIVGNGVNRNGDSEAWIAHTPPITVGAPQADALRHLELVPAGPNPFFSRVAFRLTVSGRARHVRASVYSIDGRLVRELMNRLIPAGGIGMVGA